jgi:hypothetical protein
VGSKHQLHSLVAQRLRGTDKTQEERQGAHRTQRVVSAESLSGVGSKHQLSQSGCTAPERHSDRIQCTGQGQYKAGRAQENMVCQQRAEGRSRGNTRRAKEKRVCV